MRALTLVVLFGLSAPFVPVREGRDGRQFTIALGVDLVVLNVTVTDHQGQHVPGLTGKDFEVYENGRRQAVSLFDADDVPASVELIVDNSGSMRGKRADVAAAALAFVGASNPDDELSVITFNERVSAGPPLSMQRADEMVRLALLGREPTGRTALYDALAAGIEQVAAGTRHRKALIVLSDGGDNASRHRLDDVLALAQRSSATISTIGIEDEADPERDHNLGILGKIADETGGRAYVLTSLGDLDRVWREIAESLRHEYTLGYYSTQTDRDGLFRRVDVTARRPGGPTLHVHTRRGYRAMDAAPSGDGR